MEKVMEKTFEDIQKKIEDWDLEKNGSLVGIAHYPKIDNSVAILYEFKEVMETKPLSLELSFNYLILKKRGKLWINKY